MIATRRRSMSDSVSGAALTETLKTYRPRNSTPSTRQMSSACKRATVARVRASRLIQASSPKFAITWFRDTLFNMCIPGSLDSRAARRLRATIAARCAGPHREKSTTAGQSSIYAIGCWCSDREGRRSLGQDDARDIVEPLVRCLYTNVPSPSESPVEYSAESPHISAYARTRACSGQACAALEAFYILFIAL